MIFHEIRDEQTRKATILTKTSSILTLKRNESFEMKINSKLFDVMDLIVSKAHGEVIIALNDLSKSFDQIDRTREEKSQQFKRHLN